MTALDPEKERQRLDQLYAGMTLEQLQEIAVEAQSLTNLAREALDQEIQRRGEAPLPPQVDESPEYSDDPGQPAVVMLRRFRDLPEALLAKGRLDASGIECFLADDNMVRMDWFMSNFFGGVKLLVHQEDASEALAILDQPTPDNFEVEGIGEYQQPRCPQCGSLDVSFEELNKPIAYATAYMRLPLPIHNKGWNCHACGNRWDGPADYTDAPAAS